MNKLYTKPIDDESIKLFNIKENSYIQTSILSKDSFYNVQATIRLFNDILNVLECNYQHMITCSSHNILDNPIILSLMKVEYDLAKNSIIEIIKQMFSQNNDKELKETLEYINNFNTSDIYKMSDDTYKKYIYFISTDILKPIHKLPYNEISQIYYEYQTIPPKLIKEVKKIIFEQ